MRYPYIKTYTKNDIELAELTRAMSHPGRIAIVRLLRKRVLCSFKDLEKILPLAQTTVSQHLKILRDSGIIIGQSKGGLNFYRLNNKALRVFYQGLKTLCN